MKRALIVAAFAGAAGCIGFGGSSLPDAVVSGESVVPPSSDLSPDGSASSDVHEPAPEPILTETLTGDGVSLSAGCFGITLDPGGLDADLDLVVFEAEALREAPIQGLASLLDASATVVSPHQLLPQDATLALPATLSLCIPGEPVLPAPHGDVQAWLPVLRYFESSGTWRPLIDDDGDKVVARVGSSGAVARFDVTVLGTFALARPPEALLDCVGPSGVNCADADGDGVRDPFDLCPQVADPDQQDTDGDGIGDLCDDCPDLADADAPDVNTNGFSDACDPCLTPDGGVLACADADPCNGEELCDPFAGGCVDGPAPPGCCTEDAHCPGDRCASTPTCQPDNTCVMGPAPQCDDGDACTGQESCDPQTGCIPGVAINCSDGEPCNGVEPCLAGGVCGPSPGAADCDDQSQCTTDSCEPGVGCVHEPVQCGAPPPAQCIDGDVLVVYSGPGSCISNALGCEFPFAVEDCAAQSLVCDAGAAACVAP